METAMFFSTDTVFDRQNTNMMQDAKAPLFHPSSFSLHPFFVEDTKI
jgi:hypothetical protein